MKRVLMVHNRPVENDCYDDFAAWLGELAGVGGVVYFHWRKALQYCELKLPAVVCCCLQDPVPPRSRRRAVLQQLAELGVPLLNGPAAMDRADRRVAYPRWREAGLLCPDGPWPYSREAASAVLSNYGGIILKDLTRQMGRGYLVKSEPRLQDVVYTMEKFDEEKYWVLPYVDLRDSGGRHSLHRYVVARRHGDKDSGWLAVPTVLSRTRSWCSKASHMKPDALRWRLGERETFEADLLAFWRSEPHPDVARAVESLGLDFALVDATLVHGDGVPIQPGEDPAGTRPFLWEVNPCMNLRPAEAVGKRERWWPVLGQLLLGRDLPVGEPTAEMASAYVQNVLDWQGYKQHWRDKAKEEKRPT